MNKRIYLISTFITTAILFAALPARAFDWGVIDNYENESKDYALHKVLNNIPIKYAIEISSDYLDTDDNYEFDELANAMEEQMKISEFKGVIETSFNVWPKETKEMIIKEGREKEFADIMPILSKRIILKKVNNKKEADIVFIFSSRKEMKCPSRAAACIDFAFNPIQVNLEDPYATSEKKDKKEMERRKNLLFSNIVHELGHYFALNDQYEEKENTSIEHSTFNRTGNYDSVMAAHNSPHLSCDDVDGFINVIDLSLEKFSTRAQDGWASFCNGKRNGKGDFYQEEFYREGKVINRPSHKNSLYTLTFNEQGDLAKLTAFDPLDLYGKKTIPTAAGSGLVKEMFDEENNVRYFYSYNEIDKGIINIFLDVDYKKVQYIRTDEKQWEFSSFNDKVKLSFSIGFDEDKCSIYNSFNTSTNKNLDVSINYYQNNQPNDISYDIGYKTLTLGGIKTKYPANFILDIEKDICYITFNEYSKDSFIELYLNDINRISDNDKVLDVIERKYNLSHNEIIDHAYNICREMKEEINKEKYKYKCNYFRRIEQLYRHKSRGHSSDKNV